MDEMNEHSVFVSLFSLSCKVKFFMISLILNSDSRIKHVSVSLRVVNKGDHKMWQGREGEKTELVC